MDNDEFLIAKGVIDGKDKTLSSICGAFICVSSTSKQYPARTRFMRSKLPPEAPVSDVLAVIAQERAADEDNLLTYCENALKDYVDINRLFLAWKEREEIDAKAAERKIRDLFSERFEISVMTFLELSKVTESELVERLPFMEDVLELEREQRAKAEAKANEDDEDEEDDIGETEEKSNEMFIRCAPITDPVTGIAPIDISPGDVVICLLQRESSYYNTFEKNIPGFDGTLPGTVKKVSPKGLGKTSVVLTLSEGVSGIMSVSNSVRMKAAGKGRNTAAASRHSQQPSSMASISVGIFSLCVIILIIVFFM
ncbi:hypothetical protein FACS1894167_09220 [Synergistales bacterium]|nr:hypothetical protein FACS1894167_09220 [Synergistales bacterium]